MSCTALPSNVDGNSLGELLNSALPSQIPFISESADAKRALNYSSLTLKIFKQNLSAFLHEFLVGETGFEPATPTMSTWCSTTELLAYLYTKLALFESKFKLGSSKKIRHLKCVLARPHFFNVIVL